MDVRGLEIAQTGVQEGTDSDPPFLSGSECDLPGEMAACRPQAFAAGTLRDAGAVKYLDFRIYFAIIRSALAVIREPQMNRTQRSSRCVLLFVGCSPLPILGWIG